MVAKTLTGTGRRDLPSWSASARELMIDRLVVLVAGQSDAGLLYSDTCSSEHTFAFGRQKPCDRSKHDRRMSCPR
jgi:hypothetical protein